MNKLVIILLLVASSAVAQSDFSRSRLFPQGNAELWRRALGIDTNSYVTSNSITNIIIGGTNISLIYSNGAIIINAAGATNSSSSGITNIVLTSTNLIISGSPMSGGGGTFTVDLPFLTNWFVTTNAFQNYTNTAVDTNTFRQMTNVYTTTNTFRDFTNTIVAVNTNLLIDTNTYLNPTNIGIRRPLFYRWANLGVITSSTNLLISGFESTNQASLIQSLNAVGTATSGTTSNGVSVNYTTAASSNAAMAVSSISLSWFYAKPLYYETLCFFDNTNAMRTFAGFIGGATAANAPINNASEGAFANTHIVGFKYSSTAGHTTWWVYSGNASATTSNNTSVAMSANTLYHLAMYVDAASSVSYFWINGSLVVSNIGTPPAATATCYYNIVHSTQEAVTKQRNFYGSYAEMSR